MRACAETPTAAGVARFGRPRPDAAAINCNIWLAPDEANNNPEGGGIEIYRARADDSEQRFSYQYRVEAGRRGGAKANQSATVQQRRLEESGYEHVVVPHKQNRMVLFDSLVFHRTMDLDFKPGFTNRRISFSMLFGKPLTARTEPPA